MKEYKIYQEQRGLNVPNYQRGVCIFIDILGTRDTRDFDEKYRIHKNFHEEAIESGAGGHAHTAFSRKVISFSDCAYHFYFYKNQNTRSDENDVNLMHTALANVSASILRFYNSKIIVRGGACFGDYYIDDLGFFGPAVELAYKLESSCAKMPRVMIENDIGKKLFDFERDDIDPLAYLINASNSYFVEREDNSYTLNEFCYLERAGKFCLKSETLSLGNIVQSLLKISRKHLANCSDSRIKEKHEYFYKKVEKRLSIVKMHLVNDIKNAAMIIPEATPDDIVKIICSDCDFDIEEFVSNDEIRIAIGIARNNM